MALITLLLEYKANTDRWTANNFASPTVGRDTALAEAAGKGYSDVCTLLLSHGANPNFYDEYAGDIVGAPLLRAVNGGYFDICKLLVEKGADPNKQIQYQNTSGSCLMALPIIIAIDKGFDDIVRFLLPLTDLDKPYATGYTGVRQQMPDSKVTTCRDYLVEHGYNDLIPKE